MVSRNPILAVASAIAITLVAGGCATTAEPETSPTATVSPSETATPTPTPEPDIALPTCETMFSAEMITALSADGLVVQADNLFGGPSTFDGVLNVLNSLSESITCTWILPNSDSSFSTTVAVVSDGERFDLTEALAEPAFTASSAFGGSLYSYEYDGEGTYFTESHLIVGEVSVSTTYGSGLAEPLTLDAAEQLLQ